MDWRRKMISMAEKLAASKSNRESVDLELDALLPVMLDQDFKGKL
jgi:hypothetical protein